MEQDKESEESAESDLGETGFKASCVCLSRCELCPLQIMQQHALLSLHDWISMVITLSLSRN